MLAIDTVLRNYELSMDELEDGWVDGGDDGGIDGFYVFIDGNFLSDQFELKYVRHEPYIEVYVLTIKYAEGFKQSPIIKSHEFPRGTF